MPPARQSAAAWARARRWRNQASGPVSVVAMAGYSAGTAAGAGAGRGSRTVRQTFQAITAAPER